MVEQPLYIVYRNWRGELGVRTIYPKSTYFGVTDWHPEPQWFLLARDEDKGATRDFAMADIISMHRSFDEAENSCHIVAAETPVVLGDEFDLVEQGVRLKVVDVVPAKPRTEPTAFMPAQPAAPETYVVMETNGPTPGAQWTVSAQFFRAHCTRVQGDNQ